MLERAENLSETNVLQNRQPAAPVQDTGEHRTLSAHPTNSLISDSLRLAAQAPAGQPSLRHDFRPADKDHGFPGSFGLIDKDGSIEFHNAPVDHMKAIKHLDRFGSFQLHHRGAHAEESYDLTYVHKDHYLQKTYKDATGHTYTTGSDGSRKIEDRKGNSETFNPEGSDPQHETYSRKLGITKQENSDGTVIKIFDSDGHSESVEPDGTRTSKWLDGRFKIEKRDEHGATTTVIHQPDHAGGYREQSRGPRPADRYDETYSRSTGITRRVEARGTTGEKTTISLPDGTVKVLNHDGKNYERHRDGSEHHWGKENFDTPAYDYDHNESLEKSHRQLTELVEKQLPPKLQEEFKNGLKDFESRARQAFMPPAEMKKTYEEFSRLLETPDSQSVVSAGNRAILAAGLMHIVAQPGDVNQGQRNTCNVTSVLKFALTKNPSAAVEMAATTALTGSWTAADGHKTTIDGDSLIPGDEEKVYPPASPEDRLYATQLLNLTMVNDALGRRPKPQSYRQVQTNPDLPEDSGERRFNARQELITSRQYDRKSGTWITAPDSSPGLSDREIERAGQLLNKDTHVLSDKEPQSGVDSFNNVGDFRHYLHQLKDQGKYPVTLGVDGAHRPIQPAEKEAPGFMGHCVELDAYDHKTDRVFVTNQWGKDSNGWMKVDDLYRNLTGKYAKDNDGINRDDVR
jgi:hypothetical protein